MGSAVIVKRRTYQSSSDGISSSSDSRVVSFLIKKFYFESLL